MAGKIYDNIPNSTPLNYFTGIEDFPGTGVAPRDPMFAIHTPLVPIYTEKGTTDKVYLTAAERALMYGINSFDKQSKYYDLNSKLSNTLIAQGNVHATQRIKPSDAPANANYTLYIDVLEADVPHYLRNSDGSIKKNALQVAISSGVIPGCKVKYFVQHHTNGITRGAQTIRTGSMIDGVKTSNLYPIMDIAAAEFGEAYSNIGIKIAPVTGARVMSDFITKAKALPYDVSIIERPDAKTTGKVVKSLSGGAYTTVMFKKGGQNPYTEAQLDVDLLLPHNWYNTDPSGSKIKYYDIDNIHFYYDNLESVLNKFIATEITTLSDVPDTWEDGVDAATLDWFDFSNDSDISEEIHLFNWVSLKSSGQEVSYISVQKSDEVVAAPLGMEEVTIGSDSVLYLRGGGNGTISLEETSKWIKSLMDQYLDEDSEVQSLVTNKESGMYDVGYDLPTKKIMANMIALRPDTIVHWCSWQDEYGEIPMSIDEEFATAVSLMGRIELFPESEIFATSVCRGTIILGSMRELNSPSKRRFTQNYELANILAAYLGALTGRMKPLKCLDAGRANTILTLGKDYEPRFIPKTFKETLWTNGVSYSEDYKINQKAFISIKTVHGNEYSLLTSPIVLYTNAIMCRAMDDAHKEFAGNEKDDNEVFANMLVSFLEAKMKGVIDNDRYTIEWVVTFTENDLNRKYSYHVTGYIRGNVIKTVQVSSVKTYAN